MPARHGNDPSWLPGGRSRHVHTWYVALACTMLHARLILSYDWGSDVELQVLEFPLSPVYGKTVAEAHTRLLRTLDSAELAVILDQQRRSWLVHRGTLKALWLWESPEA